MFNALELVVCIFYGYFDAPYRYVNILRMWNQNPVCLPSSLILFRIGSKRREADGLIPLDDDRQFPGLQEYFGNKPSIWAQTSGSLGDDGNVYVSLTCDDTVPPTQQPTQQPTEEPTQQPTVAPTELCTAVTLTVSDKSGEGSTAVTKYNGIYVKQGTTINGRDWWKQRYNANAHLTIVSPPARDCKLSYAS